MGSSPSPDNSAAWRTAERHLRKRHRRNSMWSSDKVREMLARDPWILGSWTCAGTGKHGRPSGAVMLVVNLVTEETPTLVVLDRGVNAGTGSSIRERPGLAMAPHRHSDRRLV